MDISTLQRDEDYMDTCVVEVGDALIAKVPLAIYIPRRWDGGRLAKVSKETYSLAVYAIVDKERQKYAVSKACAVLQFTPSSTTITKFEDGEYYEFSFDKGQTICPNVNLLKQDTLVYSIYDDIIAKGHFPWYLDCVDVATLLMTCDYHGGLNLGPSNVPIEMIVASITRNRSDLRSYYRHILNQDMDIRHQPVQPELIEFRNIIYGATNVTAKLLGSYFDDALTSALVNPSEKAEGIESLLRK